MRIEKDGMVTDPGLNLLDSTTFDFINPVSRTNLQGIDDILHAYYSVAPDEHKPILASHHKKLMEAMTNNEMDPDCPDHCFPKEAANIEKGGHGSGNFRDTTSRYEEVIQPTAKITRIKHAIGGHLIQGQSKIPAVLRPGDFVAGHYSHPISKEGERQKYAVLVTGKAMLAGGSTQKLHNSPMEFSPACCNPFLARKKSSMTLGAEAVEKDLKKYMSGPCVGGMASIGLASDPYYLQDLSDEGLGHLYQLMHSEYDSQAPKDNQVERSLQAEITMRFEFKERNLDLPTMDDDLTKVFNETLDRVQKSTPSKATMVETSPDSEDQHIHKILNLNEDGDGVTEEAGNPPHTHNVDNFQVLPVESEEIESQHPGSVTHRMGKMVFKKDGSWEAEFNFCKVDLEKRLVGGIVYEPDVVDAQDDSASDEEIVKACHNFMINSMVNGIMHKQKAGDKVKIVENYIAPCNFSMDGQIVRKGSWVMFAKIMDDQLWKDCKAGKYTGWSMAGRARNVAKSTEIAYQKIMDEAEEIGISKELIEKIIRQVGNQYCVFSEDGSKRLGCHPDKESAIKQLIAIEQHKKTAKHLSESWITQEQVRKACPSCADLMKQKKIRKIKIGALLDSDRFRKAFGEGKGKEGHKALCAKFGDDKGFYTRCHASMSNTDIQDPEGFCAELKNFCHGHYPGSERQTKKNLLSLVGMLKGENQKSKKTNKKTKR